MNLFISILFLLVFGHSLADYALQNRFMAIGKNPTLKHLPEYNTPNSRKWYHKMIAHCSIHGGMVMLFTGSVGLGILEFAMHWIIDMQKCKKNINADVDQALHILCKIIYALHIAYVIS